MPRRRAIANNVSSENQLLPRWLVKCCSMASIFRRSRARVSGNEEIGVAEFAVIFRNLVLKHEVIAKGVVGELGEKPVVLMSITHSIKTNQRYLKFPSQPI